MAVIKPQEYRDRHSNTHTLTQLHPILSRGFIISKGLCMTAAAAALKEINGGNRRITVTSTLTEVTRDERV